MKLVRQVSDWLNKRATRPDSAIIYTCCWIEIYKNTSSQFPSLIQSKLYPVIQMNTSEILRDNKNINPGIIVRNTKWWSYEYIMGRIHGNYSSPWVACKIDLGGMQIPLWCLPSFHVYTYRHRSHYIHRHGM